MTRRKKNLSSIDHLEKQNYLTISQILIKKNKIKKNQNKQNFLIKLL